MYNNNIPQNNKYYKINSQERGFLAPFILGGIAGTLISPRLNNNNYPVYYPNNNYYPYPNSYYPQNNYPVYMPYPYR